MKKKTEHKKIKKIASQTVVVSGGFDPVHIGHIRLFQEAKKLGHDYISTEHLLLVILHDEDCVAIKVLRELDVSLSKLEKQVMQLIEDGK